MRSIAQKGEMIVMEDQENYIVLATLEYNGENYLRLIKTGEVMFDTTYQVNEKEKIYVKEIIDENEDYFFEYVKDENLLKELKKL